jgi:glycosyltransferase involved in cell wall biosynthesis
MVRESHVVAVKRDEDLAAARVAILMCTKDGAGFIDDQLKSIANQTHENWVLIVSDDGSNDRTLAKLQNFAEAHQKKLTIRNGPGKGVCANFLSLTNDPTIAADYFAFSDQDDVWHADKLRRALAWLASVPVDVPALYCGRTELMSMDEHSHGFSPLFTRPPAFRNALVQNLGGGNTMVFNWWAYQLVSGTGGIVYYDPQPMLKYRQHRDNLIGSNLGWPARLVRLRMMLSGRFRDWNDTNVAALSRLPAHLLQSNNRTTLEQFAKARSGSLRLRLYNLKRSGVYRQTLLGNLGLLMAAILRRL